MQNLIDAICAEKKQNNADQQNDRAEHVNQPRRPAPRCSKNEEDAQHDAREDRKIKSRRCRPTKNRVDQRVGTSDPEKAEENNRPSDNDDDDVHARAKISLARRFTSFFALLSRPSGLISRIFGAGPHKREHPT